jgi:hypothetical protein
VRDLPDKVGIAHHTFSIRELSAKKANKGGFGGDCNYVKSRIRVRLDNQSGPEICNVLLHEILHGCWYAQGLPPEAEEEVAVTALANVLTQVIRDNPEVVSYLVEMARK